MVDRYPWHATLEKGGGDLIFNGIVQQLANRLGIKDVDSQLPQPLLVDMRPPVGHVDTPRANKETVS